MEKRKVDTKKLAMMGMLTALSVVLVAVIHFPIFPAAAFLEYDPADIPIFIGTFLFGPVSGLAITLVASTIQGLTVSVAAGPIGIIMHFLSTGSFVIVAGLIYKKGKSLKRAIIALAAGTLTMTLAMVICNLVFTPIFMGAPMESVIEMLLPVIVPFNLMKAGVNSVITYLVYKPTSKFVHRILNK
ncbi:MAG: ECF transporter S component [Oscillospiraceae bacterium]